MLDVEAYIFDLDGVLVDTARYHYLAWRSLADELKIRFTEAENENFKGVGRLRCMELLAEMGGLSLTKVEMNALAEIKNQRYVAYLEELDSNALLPGAIEYLSYLKGKGAKIALGSASRNAPLILKKLCLISYFDTIVDGTVVSRAKPDPEVFLAGARALACEPACCAVFEDSLAGIEAARKAGMYAVGVGTPEALPGADMYISMLADLLS